MQDYAEVTVALTLQAIPNDCHKRVPQGFGANLHAGHVGGPPEMLLNSVGESGVVIGEIDDGKGAHCVHVQALDGPTVFVEEDRTGRPDRSVRANC